jgi:hypothetical protein
MRSAPFLYFGLILAGSLAAQQGSLTGPVEAYTFDAPTRSLRAVIGFAGASSFGPALRDNLDFASVAPRQTYGVAFQGGQCMLITGLGSAKILTQALTGVEAQPDAIVWSGDGSHAVLYSRSGNWLQTISGFPGTPTAGSRVAGSSLGGVLASVAVDAQGKVIAAGISGDAGAAYQSSDGQTFDKLASAANPISLSFSTDSTTLYVLDSSAPQVIAVTVASGGLQTIPLAGLANPMAIQAGVDSANNEQLYIAAAGAPLVRILDVATQQIVTDIPLSFQPTCLDQFGSNSFVVASRSQAARPLWIFASTPAPGAAYFVPAIQLQPPDHRRLAIPGGVR